MKGPRIEEAALTYISAIKENIYRAPFALTSITNGLWRYDIIVREKRDDDQPKFSTRYPKSVFSIFASVLRWL